MTFVESIKVCFSRYAEFNGRATRPEFWWWFLFVFLAGIAAGIVSEALSALFSLATLLPSLAVGARRLHDTNRSGWWQLLALVPVIGWIIVSCGGRSRQRSRIVSVDAALLPRV